MDVFRRRLGAQGELHFDLVADFEPRLRSDRHQRRFAPDRDPLEVVAFDAEQVAARLGRQLLGRELPGRGGEEQSRALLLDRDGRILGAATRVELVARHDKLIFLAGEPVGLEDEGRGLRSPP